MSTKWYRCILFLMAMIGLYRCDMAQKKIQHIVFVTGDEEYRSEESMPMLARILKRELGARVTVLYAIDSSGSINPNTNDNIPGLEALVDADMMVLFLRWRELPPDQVKYITDFAESGRPMVGFRTSTHAFKYVKDTTRRGLNDNWPYEVFGQRWITHHGHFEDGKIPLTSVYFASIKSHKILNGVQPFEANSWLYHVDGGEDKLNPKCVPMLKGKSLKSKHEMNNAIDKYPLEQPVAWTTTYTGREGKTARVFFTTLGHPYDFKNASMRKLAVNGMAWAMGYENKIPEDGFKVDFVENYDPNNSGFGDKYKKNLLPYK